MKTLGVFGFGQFMEFFTPYFLDTFEVYIYDRKGKKEAIQKVGASPASFEEVAKCDFVLLGYPANCIEDLVKDILPYLQAEAVVFDICSVKTPAIEAMIKYLPKNCHIIGTHPIFGPQVGKGGIQGLKIVLSNIRADKDVYTDFKQFFEKQLGLQIFEMTPEEHDKEMAYIQGVTHFIGRALKRINIPNTLLATKSYEHLRETSELVGYDSDDLFLSIQKDNPYVAEIREQLMEEFRMSEELIDENK